MNPENLNQEQILNSEEFNKLYNNVSWNNLKLNEIPEAERKLALWLFHNGLEDSVKGLEDVLYKFKVPTISEYLDNHLSELSPKIFPVWRREFADIFKTGSRVWELIFSGSIGSGKTTIAIVAQIYNLIRVLALRQPQEVLGVMKNDLLFIMLVSITLEKAGNALLKKFVNTLEFCDYFQKVKSEDDFKDFENKPIIPYVHSRSHETVYLPHSTQVTFGSQISHALSYALIGAVMDEAEFRVRGMEDAVLVYKNLKDRVRSRFLDKKSLILLTLISSSRFEKGIIADMIKKIQTDAESREQMRYLAFPLWEVREFDSYATGHFYVMRGTKSHPSKVLDETEQSKFERHEMPTPPNCKIIKVPETYRGDFTTSGNIESSLRDLAGEQTFGSEFLFDDLTMIEFPDLMGEVTVKLNLGTGKRIRDQLPAEFTRMYNGRKKLNRYPNAARYIHLDLAETAEAGIGIVHKEDQDGKIIIVVDLACRIITDTRIDLEEILKFIHYLRDELDVKFNTATADRFQSAYILQKFKTDRIADEENVKIFSMDKETWPYRQFSDIVGSDGFHVGKCPILTRQMEGVMEEVNDETGKVTIAATGKKDLSDGVGGAVVNALLFTRDLPIYPRKIATTRAEILMASPEKVLEL